MGKINLISEICFDDTNIKIRRMSEVMIKYQRKRNKKKKKD